MIHEIYRKALKIFNIYGRILQAFVRRHFSALEGFLNVLLVIFLPLHSIHSYQKYFENNKIVLIEEIFSLQSFPALNLILG
jgi:hypothetical protein